MEILEPITKVDNSSEFKMGTIKLNLKSLIEFSFLFNALSKINFKIIETSLKGSVSSLHHQ